MMPYLREPFGSDILKGCRIHKWKTDQEDVLKSQKIRKGFKFFSSKDDLTVCGYDNGLSLS